MSGAYSLSPLAPYTPMTAPALSAPTPAQPVVRRVRSAPTAARSAVELCGTHTEFVDTLPVDGDDSDFADGDDVQVVRIVTVRGLLSGHIAGLRCVRPLALELRGADSADLLIRCSGDVCQAPSETVALVRRAVDGVLGFGGQARPCDEVLLYSAPADRRLLVQTFVAGRGPARSLAASVSLSVDDEQCQISVLCAKVDDAPAVTFDTAVRLAPGLRFAAQAVGGDGLFVDEPAFALHRAAADLFHAAALVAGV